MLNRIKFLSVLGWFAFTASVGFASEEIMDLFLKHYPLAVNTQLNNCVTCHSPDIKGGLNGYGIELKEHNLDFVAIEKLDPDKDRKTSGDEIAQGAFPGSQAYEQGLFIFKLDYGVVPFDHRAHITEAKFGINGDCNLCHADAGVSFPKVFDDNIPIEGRVMICINCHAANAGPAHPALGGPNDCVQCHQR